MIKLWKKAVVNNDCAYISPNKKISSTSPREADRPPTFYISSLSDEWYCSVNGNVCSVYLHCIQMQFSCCGRENSSSTQLAHTQLRGRSRSRKETLLVEPVTIGISCLMVLVCSCRRAKGSPFQRAESDWQAHRHLHRGLVLSTEGRRTRLGAECPLLEKENFSPVWNQEMQNTPSCYGHHLELEMVRLWSSQLLCEPLACYAWKQLLFFIWQLLLDWRLTNLP